jgi:branched-chain amino acid transport system ATP-binding protein
MSTLLEVNGLAAGYGETPAVFDATFSVDRGEVVALLGANGAGKTTTLLAVAGFLPPTAGEVLLEGASIRGLAPHLVARRSLAMVTDDRALIPGLTVSENLALVRQKQVDALDVFPELRRLERRPAGLLSGGEQQMLAIARAIMPGPALLLIDELSLGLAPLLVSRLLSALRDVAVDLKTGVLVVEQHVEQILGCADRAYVMSRGRVSLQGQASDLLQQRSLLEASYLGTLSPAASNGSSRT